MALYRYFRSANNDGNLPDPPSISFDVLDTWSAEHEPAGGVVKTVGRPAGVPGVVVSVARTRVSLANLSSKIKPSKTL